MEDPIGTWTAAVETWWDSLGVWQMPIRIVVILLLAFLTWVILQFVIRRVVRRHRQRRQEEAGRRRHPGAPDLAPRRRPHRAAHPHARRRAEQRGDDDHRDRHGRDPDHLRSRPNATGAFSLITAALGAGLGFGAQNIVKDVLNGLFMVTEDQLGVGDVVDLGPATGVVEAVGIRITAGPRRQRHALVRAQRRDPARRQPVAGLGARHHRPRRALRGRHRRRCRRGCSKTAIALRTSRSGSRSSSRSPRSGASSRSRPRRSSSASS